MEILLHTFFFLFLLLFAIIHSMQYSNKKNPINLEPAIQLRKFIYIPEIWAQSLG